MAIARGAFADELAGGGLAIECDGGHAAAIGVSVRLVAHHACGGDDLDGEEKRIVGWMTHHVQEQRHSHKCHC